MKRIAFAFVEALLVGALAAPRWLRIQHRNHPRRELHRWQPRVQRLRRHRNPPHLSIIVGTLVITRNRPNRALLLSRARPRPLNHLQWPQVVHKAALKRISRAYRA
jgi:hypothetical protein